MKNAKLFSLNLNDLVKGFVVAFLTVVVSGVYSGLESGTLPTLNELKTLTLLGLASGASYLLKNFLTNSDDKLLKPESK